MSKQKEKLLDHITIIEAYEDNFDILAESKISNNSWIFNKNTNPSYNFLFETIEYSIYERFTRGDLLVCISNNEYHNLKDISYGIYYGIYTEKLANELEKQKADLGWLNESDINGYLIVPSFRLHDPNKHLNTVEDITFYSSNKFDEVYLLSEYLTKYNTTNFKHIFDEYNDLP